MAFPRPIRKESLYEIEQGIGEAYQLNSVFLMPEYPQETFYEEYFREAVKEASRVGVVSKGFFEDYTYRIEGREITISLPFGEGGLSLLEKGKISEILERILKNEFGLEFSVRIRQSKSSAEVNQEYAAEKKKQLEELMKGGFAFSEAKAEKPVLRQRKKSRTFPAERWSKGKDSR